MTNCPIAVMWESAGRPEVEFPVTDGVCMLTGERGPVHAALDIVSGNFSSWERLPFRHGGTGFGRAAAWGFRHRPLRQRVQILASGKLQEAKPSDLRAVLGSALPSDTIVGVPIGRQKHVLPWARWGCVATDNEVVRWTDADAERLAHMQWLRAQGFGEGALVEEAPRWDIVRKSLPVERSEVLRLWPLLEPWRRHEVYMSIGLRATRQDKDREEKATDVVGD